MALNSSTVIDSSTGSEVVSSSPQIASKAIVFTSKSVMDHDLLSQQLNQMQQQLQEVIRAITTYPLLPCVLVKGVTFSSGVAQIVSHRLGRKFQGFYLVNRRGGTGDGQQSDLSPLSRHENEIQITTSATMTVDVVVY